MPEPELETVACPSCQSQAPRAVYEFSPYRVVRCQSCGLHFLSPRLTEAAMMRHYAGDSYFSNGEIGYSSYAKEEQATRVTFRRLMKILQRRGHTGGSLLEIGCAHGYLLDEAKPFFTTRVGIDFSPEAVEQARKTTDRVYQGGIEKIPAGETFDCICLISVIEHVYSPITFLSALRSHLKPGGTMFVATPDLGSFWRTFKGRNWWGFSVIPEHVLFLEKKSLSNLMQAAGLTRIESVPYHRAFNTHVLADDFKIMPGILNRMKEFNIWAPWYYLALSGQSAKI
jgi:2-polyprenyl-3-methyl-5-hydroxy-6-metoxy-1,4-benzoquinol methylase